MKQSDVVKAAKAVDILSKLRESLDKIERTYTQNLVRHGQLYFNNNPVDGAEFDKADVIALLKQKIHANEEFLLSLGVDPR